MCKEILHEKITFFRQSNPVDSEARGQAKGMLAAKRETLQNLIQLKFGDLPEWAQVKINTAEKEQIDQWVARSLTANSIKALLAAEGT